MTDIINISYPAKIAECHSEIRRLELDLMQANAVVGALREQVANLKAELANLEHDIAVLASDGVPA